VYITRDISTLLEIFHIYCNGYFPCPT